MGAGGQDAWSHPYPQETQRSPVWVPNSATFLDNHPNGCSIYTVLPRHRNLNRGVLFLTESKPEQWSSVWSPVPASPGPVLEMQILQPCCRIGNSRNGPPGCVCVAHLQVNLTQVGVWELLSQREVTWQVWQGEDVCDSGFAHPLHILSKEVSNLFQQFTWAP